MIHLFMTVSGVTYFFCGNQDKRGMYHYNREFH